MTATIIVLIILLMLSLFIVPFERDRMKDRIELQNNPINKKFFVLVSIVNNGLLDGHGDITLFDDNPRLMNLMDPNRKNLLIQFVYSTGTMTIILNYKHWQKELVFKQQFHGLRNSTALQQQYIGDEFAENCKKKMREHEQKVGYEDMGRMENGQHDSSGSAPENPMNMMGEVFSSLTVEQKRSVANFLYLIGMESGQDEHAIVGCPGMTQTILMLKVPWHDCKQQLDELGEEKVYADLQGIEGGMAVMMMVSGLQICYTLTGDTNKDALEKRYYDSFERIGYPPSQVNANLQKISALGNMFGI